MLDAWDRFWDAEIGSDEEAFASAECLYRQSMQVLNHIDESAAAAAG